MSAKSVLLCLALVGCGGGSGNKGGPDIDARARFSGVYHLGAVGVIFESGAASSTSAWGTAMPDGAGAVPLSRFENGDGMITGPIADADNGYNVSATGEMTWHALAAPGTPILRGALSADNQKAVLCQIEAGEKPLIAAFLRRSGAHTNASLSGAYHVGQFWTFHNETSPAPSAVTGTATFDGAGSGTANVTRNASGAITNDPAVALSYSIAADGAATMTFYEPFAGGVLEGGSLAVFAGSTSDAGQQRMSLYVQQTSGATAALFSGTYTLVTISGESGAHNASTATITSDGVANLTLGAGTNNDDGVISATGMDVGSTYTLAPNGTITVTTTSGQTLIGGMSADGTFGFVAGSTTAGQDPILAIFMK